MRPRIAICFSGQPRTWKKAMRSWESMLKDPRYQVDAFCHIWAFNTSSAKLEKNDPFIEVTGAEVNEMLDAIRPVSHMVEKEREFIPQSPEQALEKGAHLSQFYGVAAAARLKRLHELDRGFVYDAVVRMRYDLWVETDLLGSISTLEEDSLHGFNLSWQPENRSCMISDLCWITGGLTYDRVADFYLDAGKIDKKWFQYDYEPEHVFFHHLKSNQISVKNNPWNIRILRSSPNDVSNPEDIW